MKIFIVLVTAFMLIILVSGCGNAAGSAGQVNVYNWGEYINEDVLRIFEDETGIAVNYRMYENNENLYSLLNMGSADVDVIIPSDYMIGRLISENMLEPLDFTNIPNFELIDPKYKGLEYDPQNRFSVAYMTGTVGLIYNEAMVSENITGWGALFDERYSGQILMFDNPRDAFGIALKYLGYSQNTTNETEIREAFELLRNQKPFLQAYVMDQIFFKLESGEAALGPYYAGDYLFMLENNPDLVFVRPSEGSNFFVDAMCIPKGSKNKTNAEIFINFMSRTDIALMNVEEIWYASANAEAAASLKETLEPFEYEIMFASNEVLANCDVFANLPPHIQMLYDQLWIELKR